MLLTTHDLAEAEQLADQVIIVDHGHLLAKGSPAELVASVTGEDLRFGASPGLDVGALGTVLGADVTEVSPGEYLVAVNPTPVGGRHGDRVVGPTGCPSV